MTVRSLTILAVLALLIPHAAAEDHWPDTLAGTQPLQMEQPLDVVMVRGINAFAERALADSPKHRQEHWNRDYSSRESYEQSVAKNRERLMTIIGAVDPLVNEPRSSIHWMDDDIETALADNSHQDVFVMRLQWEVLEGVTGEGYVVIPNGPIKAQVVLIPDPQETPEALIGLDNLLLPRQQLVRRLAASGCAVLVMAPINRQETFSGHPDIRDTNLPHREFIYRLSFELGRHIIGYEVQKVRAGVSVLDDYAVFHNSNFTGVPEGPPPVPLTVAGIGEGALIAMYTAAIDQRFQSCLVSGYFSEREGLWQEPIYRNVWSLLSTFGDADIASLIAPRALIIEAAAAPVVNGPPRAVTGRANIAAPGRIAGPDIAAVRREFERAGEHYEQLDAADSIQLVETTAGRGDPGSDAALTAFLSTLGIDTLAPAGEPTDHPWDADAVAAHNALRQRRQVEELVRHTQRLLHRSDKERARFWAEADRSSVERWVETTDWYRQYIHDELIGRLPEATAPLNPRTRKVIDEPTHVGYEVVLDVYPTSTRGTQAPGFDDVISGGILLLPRDVKDGERRPVVVCQHGLEGTPLDTITTDETSRPWRAYKGFSTQLVQRGFIVYAPQNPYRGEDDFRVLQRKSNPLGRSLFSYIIEQHRQTLRWLRALPWVDADRIAFYGLSYGGKTAVRVPPLLVSEEQGGGRKENDAPGSLLLTPQYCLSICSADFNEWIRKNVSSEDRYSYVYTKEYEMFEWNMGHVAGYAELASLMTPRPFMVERGHDDGVAPDEWVAWEYAKVRRHYDQLGIGERTEIEFFNGPHTINGQGTFDFLHRHLNWPLPE